MRGGFCEIGRCHLLFSSGLYLTKAVIRRQDKRTSRSGRTPSNLTCNAGDEPWGGMDDADKSSAPSIPGPGHTPRHASGYGRCFARSRPPMIPAVLQSTSTGDRLPTTFRGTLIAKVYAFPFHPPADMPCMALQQGLLAKVDCRTGYCRIIRYGRAG